MTRDEAVQILNWRLGNRKMDEKIIAEMKYVQRTVLEENSPWLPWFLECELSSASTTAGERRLKLPDDFLLEIEEEDLWITVDGAESPLEKTDYDTGRKAYTGMSTPEAYAIASNYLQFFPIPDTSYPISMRYFAKGADITAANEEVGWLKHAADLVIAEVGAIIAGKHLQNATLAMEFKADAQAARKALYDKHIAMAEVNRSRRMGGGV